MRFDRRYAAVAALVAVTACTGTPAPTPTPKTPAVPQHIATDGEQDTSPGGLHGAVAPVKAPGEVVLHVRWANPSATAATMAGYANLPAGKVNDGLSQAVRELIRDGLSGKVDVNAFANLVRTDAPIDLVMIADMDTDGQVPEPMFAISVGLSSVQAALDASKGKARKISDGTWEIGTQDKWGEPCAVAAAMGTAPARLVCGERKAHVEKVAAFVARNIAAKNDPQHDIRVEVSLRGLLDKYGRQWQNQAKGLPVLVEEGKLGIAKFDQALMDAADAVAAEAGALIHDADSFVMDVGIDATKGAHVGVQLKFAGQQSWLVQTMLDGSQNKGPAPEIVWQLPASSDYAAWGTSGDPQRFDGIIAAGRAMLEGAMEHEGVGTAADRKAIGELVRLVSKAKHVPTVHAAGHFPNVNTNPSSITHVIDDVVGWYLFGFDDKPAEVKKWLQDAVKVYNRPSLQKLMKDELGSSDAKHLPKVKSIATPPGLGAGGLAIEVTVPDLEDPFGKSANATKPKTVDVTMYLVMMGDADRTWIGIAGNKLELIKLMAGLKGTGTATLAGRADLARMKNESHQGGAFTSLTGVVGMVKPIIYAMMSSPGAGSSAGMGQEVLKILEQMPNKGATPILMFADAVPGARPSVTWSLDISRGTLTDIGFVGENALKMAMP